MRKTKLLLGVIITLVIAFIGFKIFKQEELVEKIKPIILPLLTIYYCIQYKDTYSYFFYFLLFYAISDLTSIFYYYAETSALVDNIMYFGGNLLYIMAYVFLIFEIIREMKLAEVFSKFAFIIFLLTGLSVYCVVLISDVAVESELIATIYDRVLETAYNCVIMILLSVAVINYLYRDSRKAMTLLIGSLCIVFSEYIQVAYFYISEILFLDILYSVLLVLAFLFLYMQAGMVYEEHKIVEQEPIKELEA